MANSSIKALATAAADAATCGHSIVALRSGKSHRVFLGDASFSRLEPFCCQIMASDNGSGGNSWAVINSGGVKPTPGIATVSGASELTVNFTATRFHAVASLQAHAPPEWAGLYKAGCSVTIGSATVKIVPHGTVGGNVSPQNPALRGAPITLIGYFWPEFR